MEREQNKTLLDWAQFYALKGFKVFPLVPKNKTPLVKNGFYSATTDTEQIKKWWVNAPNANIGIATGGFTVIDADVDEEKGKQGTAELYEWQQENGVFPETLTAKTGRGGYHYFFRTSESFGNRTNILPAVDVRGEGGYIVAPPSIHPNGKSYEWYSGDFDNIAEANEAVIKFLKQEKPKTACRSLQSREKDEKSGTKEAAKKPRPFENELAETLNFGEGERNDSLFRYASSLQARGYTDSAILDLMAEVNAERCVPPLEDKEIDTIFKSVVDRYSKGIPRTVAAVGNIPEYEEKIKQRFPFIVVSVNEKTGDVSYSVSCPLLARYIREHNSFFFLDTMSEHPVSFWYSADNGYYKQCTDNDFKGHIKAHIEAFSELCVKTKDLEEVYRLLVTDRKSRKASELDGTSNLICFENGLLNIDTLELVPHSPEVLCTIQIPCRWNANADKCPTFTQFLDTLTSGNKEESFLLWQYLGFTISNVPGYIPKQALFLYGPGNTGKSQLLELMKRLVGSANYCSSDIKNIEERFGAASLWRKRLTGSPDTSAMKVNELATFKTLTGGDEIGFEFKGKDKFTDKYRGVLMFCANELPKFGGDKGDHVYDRMILIHCTNVVPPEKRDRLLIEKLYAEREAIVYNAVLALQTLKESGYNFYVPEACRIAREEYKTENDNVRQFLDECTIPQTCTGYKDPCTTAAIYRAYKIWAQDSELYVQNRVDFRKSVCSYFNATDSNALELHVQMGNHYYRFTLTKEAQKELLNLW